MIIQITGRLGETKITPERAEVTVGETVLWAIEVSAGNFRAPAVRWDVYFQDAIPFKRPPISITSRLHDTFREISPREHRAYTAVINAGQAEEPGEYKYGIRAIDTLTGLALSDDDPYIVVRRRFR
jgi:hypothetical protein